MRRKSRKISFRLNERQKEVLNEGPETRALPSSGSFLHMSGSSLEAALRSLAQQLVSARHMVPMLTEKGALSDGGHQHGVGHAHVPPRRRRGTLADFELSGAT